MAMKIVNEEWTEGKTLVIEHSAMTGKITMSYDGVAFTKTGKKDYTVSVEDKTITATVSGNEFKGLDVTVLGHNVNIVQPVAWYEYLVAILIFVPCIFFGALGGALGVLSAYLCIFVMRKIDNVVVKLLVGVALGAVCVYLVMILAVSIAALFV